MTAIDQTINSSIATGYIMALNDLYLTMDEISTNSSAESRLMLTIIAKTEERRKFRELTGYAIKESDLNHNAK